MLRLMVVDGWELRIGDAMAVSPGEIEADADVHHAISGKSAHSRSTTVTQTMARAASSRPKSGVPAPSKASYSRRREAAPLAGDEVTVCWLATDGVGPADTRRWLETLDQDERARAERFHFAVDRRDFIAAHALLRAQLTRRLDIPPREWRFARDANGKPGVDPRLGAPEVAFNLSHTRGLVAVALASHGAIGVDVEEIDGAKADFAFAEAYFAPAEAELLRRTPAASRSTCFFRLWTLKEAYIKAIGAGLAAPLDSFAFTFEPIRIDFGPGAKLDAIDWRFAILPTTDRHVLSVAVGRAAGDPARLAPRALAPRDL